MSFGRGSLMTLRCQSRTAPRAFTSAPFASKNLIISGWLCAAAHISGDWPPQCSFAFTSAPALTSTFAASRRPVRATSISAVSPSELAPSTAAPAASSAAMIGVSPAIAASDSANAPKSLRASTSAPAAISFFTSVRSPL